MIHMKARHLSSKFQYKLPINMKPFTKAVKADQKL